MEAIVDAAMVRNVPMTRDAAVDMARIRRAWSGLTGVHVNTVAEVLTGIGKGVEPRDRNAESSVNLDAS